MPMNFNSPSVASPAISVIIPMYNQAKYIGECLDSILAQTFKDFEVIVVDDCSTDNSVRIVNDYVPKFGGQLSVVRMKKNSGYAGFPRNKGVELADGEYLYFIDPDDTIATTALEGLYSAAKKFNADVVHCEKNVITQPTLLTNDFEKRVREFSQKWLQCDSCLQLIRRNFLVDNRIRFQNVYSQDMIFTMCEICCAKNYLVVPKIFYYRRQPGNPQSQSELDVWRCVQTLKQGVNYLDEFLNKQAFFAKRTDLKHVLFGMLFATLLERLNDTHHKVSAEELCGILRKEIDDEKGAFAAFTFNAMDIYQMQLNSQQKSDLKIEVSSVNIKDQDFLSKKIPAISVVVPLYNMEEYIDECLDSLLNQTFQDFEVIVVDDCSTDNSVAIVKSYAPKFNGRLKLSGTEKNSGGGGYVPRNIGQGLSRGKYVFFADADDYLLPTGFETLYEAAEKFNADVTYIASYYRLDRPNEAYVFKDGVGKELAAKNLEDKLTFMADDTDKIIYDYLHRKGHHAPWSVFIKRDFLMENKILFPEKIYNGGDGVWNLQIRCLSKRFLRNPTPVYFRRCYDSESITRKMRPLAEQIAHKTRAFSLWLQALWGVSKKFDFFRENPSYIYDAFKVEMGWVLNDTRVYLEKLSDREIYESAYHEFAKDDNSSDWMLPFFFAFINMERRVNDNSPGIINKFKRYFIARIDLQLSSKTGTGDLQIVSVSDDKADIRKPPFLQKGGAGYQIQSYVGNIELSVKADVDGQIKLDLRGIDVRNPKGKPKRIPYWIDYTKFTVNGEIIFDNVTPVWHDKPYNYTLDIKAGEEIKIQAEWLPHMSADLEIKPIVSKFLPYLTSRVDVKFSTTAGGDFQILSVSDNKADIRKPDWLQKDGVGYQIQSHNGNMKLVAKASSDGQLTLNLKSLDVRMPGNYSQRIPYWIDYTKFTVNEQVVFDEPTPASHDESYDYTLDVKAGENITVNVEWLPHKGDVPKVAPPQVKVEPIADKFLPYLTSRVDVKLATTAEGDFKIVSVSDDKADVRKPDWLQKDGVGYQIQSHNGNMELVAKATADGQLTLNLKSLDVRDPKDYSKRIPYWIDYTKLTVNEQVVFDEPTPASHDEPYDYTFDVKAGEEIKIQAEWLPHKGDVPKVAPPQVEVEPIADKFLPYLTSRVDVKLATTAGGDFQIVSVSDDKADIRKPDWLQKDGVGYQIQSHNGNMELIAKTAADGQLTLNLRSLDVRMPGDYSKRIPYWIDYTKLTVNGEIVFDEPTPASHDKSYDYTLDVKAGDDITVNVEWLPHKGDS